MLMLMITFQDADAGAGAVAAFTHSSCACPFQSSAMNIRQTVELRLLSHALVVRLYGLAWYAGTTAGIPDATLQKAWTDALAQCPDQGSRPRGV